MEKTTIRVRFAPAPTGMMHLGNVRAALINYLYAHQKNGTFVLRIEDTDQERNYDPKAEHIISDLAWLQLQYMEGPYIGGPYAPYFQSHRSAIYAQQLEILKRKGLAYPCFCTPEDLEKKKERQIALKLPPRYDRTCWNLTAQERTALLTNTPHVWRMYIDHEMSVSITDLGRGHITFELKHFSDFLLTRSDGGYTFIFANFVDDMLMKISHVFRGEDHLSNTANQAALYHAFGGSLPTFWHLPIICNLEGQKLSKRDFGFSLKDLIEGGFLPEAISNYLAVLGGSFTQEIMSQKELIQNFNFEHVHAAGQIKYDEHKLRWFNHEWIKRLDATNLLHRIYPFLVAAYPHIHSLNNDTLLQLVNLIKLDLYTLKDSVELLRFYFTEPTISYVDFQSVIPPEYLSQLCTIIEAHQNTLSHPFKDTTYVQAYFNTVKNDVARQEVPAKYLFWFMRLALTGSVHGPSIIILLEILGSKKAQERIKISINSITDTVID